jgi:thymidylate synthase (FAD)
MTLEINTTRGIAAQILRHRSFTFQEFCMAGDNEVYFDLPIGLKNGERRIHKTTLESLYNRWEKGPKQQKIIQKMNVRVFDENTRTFTNSHIKEVFKTGVKEIFEIELENGKKIKCTKEHKVLTQRGFLSLEDAVGLKRNGNTATISENVFIGCNGIPVHQDYDWLKTAKERCIKNLVGVVGIAEEAGVSYHTIRKWLKIHKLTFSKKEVAQCFSAWNKGVYGYNTKPHTKQTKEKMRQKAKRGKESNFWRGGTTTERKAIQADINKFRLTILKDYDNCCGLCGTKINGRFDLHHIIPVSINESLAREYTNLMPVHPICHRKHHNTNGDMKRWREKSTGNALTVNWAKIKKVKYLGEQMTYDLEINHYSHNYIANGIVVHNSQRYADTKLLSESQEIPDIRRQDTKNRQNSIDDFSDYVKLDLQGLIAEHFDRGQKLYNYLLEKGVAKESARFVLSLSTKTRIYMTGNCRSWITYIALREKNGTQLEHKEVAKACKAIFVECFPTIANALGGLETDWVI